MKEKLTTLVLAVATLMFATPLLAHHSFAAEFDREQPLKVTGTVTKVEWTNPHIWIYVDVKGSDGTVTNWAFQGGPPSYLTRAGWNKNDLPLTWFMMAMTGWTLRPAAIMTW